MKTSRRWQIVYRRMFNKYLAQGKAKWRKKYLLYIILAFFIFDTCGVFSYMFASSYYRQATSELDLNIPELVDTLNRGHQPKINPINQYNYSYRIGNFDKCRSTDNEETFEDITLLILVKSAIDHKKHRHAIRNSWGFENRFSDVKIRRFFLLGVGSDILSQSQIDDENTKFKDIVQADFMDNYYNNTIKALMGMKWAVLNCPKAQFIFLVDDDMYVSTKNLLKFLRNPLNVQMSASLGHGMNNEDDSLEKQKKFNQMKNIPRQIYDGRLYGGYVFPYSLPIRYKFSKWYISLSEYPYSRYPPYVTAGAVAFSFPALKDMYHASFYTKHFRFDDIYMAILAKKMGIEPIHNDNFYYHKKSYDKNGYTDVIVSHGYEPIELQKVWHEQKGLGHA